MHVLKIYLSSHNPFVTSEWCTGSFHENGRPPVGTKCAMPCVIQSGYWGSSWCYTKADKTNWGAECVKCKGKVFSYQDSSITYLDGKYVMQ